MFTEEEKEKAAYISKAVASRVTIRNGIATNAKRSFSYWDNLSQ